MNDRKRKLQKGATYQVTCKINRDEIIFTNELIIAMFLSIVKRCKKKYDFLFENFNIMGNYVQFMIKPEGNSSLPRIMQWMNSVFAKSYNKEMGISGRLWKERYSSVIIETKEQFEKTFEYLVMNPVAAKRVKRAKDYRYGGLHHYLHKIDGVIDLRRKIVRELYERCRSW